MRKQQAGFTLIELVMVIVILGILAATAMPKFVDMRTEARTAVANGVLGAARSAAAINHAAKVVGQTTTNITNATTLVAAMEGGTAPTDWRVSTDGTELCTGGAAADCTDSDFSISITTGETATAMAVVAGDW